MVQNRNKLINVFIGNLTNSIVHAILEKAVKKDKDYLADKYRKELITSFEIAKIYRDKINPKNIPLPEKDISFIEEKIVKRVKAELRIRISKGYQGLNLDEVDKEVSEALKKTNIS